jgi:hypothetical protein
VDEVVRDFMNRAIRQHPWWALFKERCPDWTTVFRLMPADDDQDEIIDWGQKTIWLAVWLPHPLLRWAHAVAHVLKHGETCGTFTEQEEDEADSMAQCFDAVYGDESTSPPPYQRRMNRAA